jgi:hypothetical protein
VKRLRPLSHRLLESYLKIPRRKLVQSYLLVQSEDAAQCAFHCETGFVLAGDDVSSVDFWVMSFLVSLRAGFGFDAPASSIKACFVSPRVILGAESTTFSATMPASSSLYTSCLVTLCTHNLTGVSLVVQIALINKHKPSLYTCLPLQVPHRFEHRRIQARSMIKA